MSLEPHTPKFASAYPPRIRRKTTPVRNALLILIALLLGFSSLYFAGMHVTPANSSMAASHDQDVSMAQMDEVNPPDGYTVPVVLDEAGPQLLAVGAIDLLKFAYIYNKAGSPLTEEQNAILKEGSSSSIVINKKNAYFLLNFFWALGLTNKNPVLTEGAMVAGGMDRVGNFASTGGWTVGAKPPMELYASTEIVALTEEQQARLLKVASAVYRPCCDNGTHFPDCNHGMAMLGLLELMASQNASEDEMFDAAKYVNAYWYPQQAVEIATYFQANKNTDFAQADAQQVVSQQVSSASGFREVHSWLVSNGLLQQAPNSGGNCGV